MKLPALLKENCLNQLDQCLANLAATARLGLALSSQIVEEYIATALVIKALSECIDIGFSVISLEENSLKKLPINAQVMVLSDSGDSFLLAKSADEGYALIAYFHVDEEVFRQQATLSELIDEFQLTPQALLICSSTNTDSGSPGNQSNHQDSKTKSYAFDHFFAHKPTILSIIGASVFMALLGVATPLGFQTFTDKILPYSATGSLYVVAILLLLSAIAASVLQCYHDYQENVLFAKYQNGLGKEVFRRLLAMEVPYFDRNKVGDLTKLVDQVEAASNFLVRQALASVVSVISLLVVLPLLFFYSPQLTSIVLGIGVLMALTIGLALKPIRNRVAMAYGYDASFQSTLIETLKGMKTIKSLANESYFRHRANIALEANLYGGFNVARLSSGVQALVNFQSQLITISVIFFGAQAVFAHELTIGQLIAFNMLANNVVNPLVSLVMTASGWENFKLANRKLNELTLPKPILLQCDISHIDLNGDIEFDNVWFRYPSSESSSSEDAQYVLKGVSFTIKKGEVIGVVGSSGSGKSTLANLLLGFYCPTKGKIKINGYDIDQIPPEVLRARISSVQQTSFLFNTSVLENVHLGRLNSTVADIHQALEASGSSSFVDDMSQKFLTQLSEDGGNLSGGQRQRLAIARALVRKSDILLFDEATSALDNRTEETIKETIYQACQDKTGIIIAHRLNTLSYCNRIVVMQAGEIEVVGTHQELLKGENSYQAMWDAMLKRDSALDRLALQAGQPITNALTPGSDRELGDAL